MQIEIRWFCAKIFNSVFYLLCFLKISCFFRNHCYSISYKIILSYFCVLFLDFVYFISIFSKIFLQQIFMYFGNFTISSCFLKFIFFYQIKTTSFLTLITIIILFSLLIFSQCLFFGSLLLQLFARQTLSSAASEIGER